MTSENLLGLLIVVFSGTVVGTSVWPIKCMRRFEYEHWGFVSTLAGFLAAPWIFTLVMCPDAAGAFGAVDTSVFVRASVLSICWGIANILYMLCFSRIGISLANGILVGVSMSVGVIAPMIVKGTGIFENTPEVTSPAGLTVLGGVFVMLAGVVLTSLAGLNRERAREPQSPPSSGFWQGLMMAVLAGALSVGFSFAFVYSQDPLRAALKDHGATELAANIGVWTTVLTAGAIVNVLFPAFLMCRHKSWKVLIENPHENVLAAIFGLSFFIGVAMMGKGMLLLGALGASVGFGVQQTMQMIGTQSVGFLGGEWKGIHGTPRALIYGAILTLIVAAIIMACGNALV